MEIIKREGTLHSKPFYSKWLYRLCICVEYKIFSRKGVETEQGAMPGKLRELGTAERTALSAV